VNVEWLMIADAAQLVGGKLYVLGGGWDVLIVTSPFPYRRRFALAASFKVPWMDTNTPHQVELKILDQDQTKVLFQISGALEVGRPLGIPAGQEQRAQMAVDVDLQFEGPGTYVAVASIGGDGGDERHYPFNVVLPPGVAVPTERGRAS
jgi:hypothetical protein